jgi:hypothetical protein
MLPDGVWHSSSSSPPPPSSSSSSFLLTERQSAVSQLQKRDKRLYGSQ